MIEIGSVWIPGPRLVRHARPRKVVGCHRFDPDLVFTQTATADGTTVSAKAALFHVHYLIENYVPLVDLTDDGGEAIR